LSRSGHGTVVALDPVRFAELWGRLRLAGDPAATFAALQRAYADPARAYHTAAHIDDCLAQLDLEPGAAARPDEVEMALWFHDAVYDSHRSDNEERSAALAAETLREAGAPPECRERIRSLVLATRHTEPPAERDAQVITDVDLSILGRPAAAFAAFERRVRREFAWVPEPEYRRARRAVLAAFLERTPLYQIEGYRRRYEVTARHNLRRALTGLVDS
jgi:predicted metal-dependent HD superfamily phosphohydrolase